MREGRRIQRDKRRSLPCEARGAAERQFERLLQQEAAEDLELMSVAILRRHDGCGAESRRFHEVHIRRLAQGVIRIVILKLALPNRVDELAFFVVRGKVTSIDYSLSNGSREQTDQRCNDNL